MASWVRLQRGHYMFTGVTGSGPLIRRHTLTITRAGHAILATRSTSTQRSHTNALCWARRMERLFTVDEHSTCCWLCVRFDERNPIVGVVRASRSETPSSDGLVVSVLDCRDEIPNRTRSLRPIFLSTSTGVRTGTVIPRLWLGCEYFSGRFSSHSISTREKQQRCERSITGLYA